jgi:hypothetical protein
MISSRKAERNVEENENEKDKLCLRREKREQKRGGAKNGGAKTVREGERDGGAGKQCSSSADCWVRRRQQQTATADRSFSHPIPHYYCATDRDVGRRFEEEWWRVGSIGKGQFRQEEEGTRATSEWGEGEATSG